MTRTEALELVVRLACQTGDRTPDEQRALLRVAMEVEMSWNALKTSNPLPYRHARLSWVVDEVLDTYEPDGKPVKGLSSKELEKVERKRQQWHGPDARAYFTHWEGR